MNKATFKETNKTQIELLTLFLQASKRAELMLVSGLVRKQAAFCS